MVYISKKMHYPGPSASMPMEVCRHDQCAHCASANRQPQPASQNQHQHHFQRDMGYRDPAHTNLHPPVPLQQSLSRAIDPYNGPYAHMYHSTLPIPAVPSTSAPGALQAFNNAEVQVQRIAPYGYGMPRYGPQPFRPETEGMVNKLNPYGRGFPYGFYKSVL